jgi:hypothetical protein
MLDSSFTSFRLGEWVVAIEGLLKAQAPFVLVHLANGRNIVSRQDKIKNVDVLLHSLLLDRLGDNADALVFLYFSDNPIMTGSSSIFAPEEPV